MLSKEAVILRLFKGLESQMKQRKTAAGFLFSSPCAKYILYEAIMHLRPKDKDLSSQTESRASNSAPGTNTVLPFQICFRIPELCSRILHKQTKRPFESLRHQDISRRVLDDNHNFHLAVRLMIPKQTKFIQQIFTR